MSEKKRTGHHETLLGAALLAQTGEARGEPPSDAELEQWAARRLPGSRLAEVESHLAHDPQALARAARFIRDHAADAPTNADAASPERRSLLQRLSDWFAGPPAAVAALGIAAVAVATVLFISQRPAPPGLTGKGEQVLRDARAAHPDWRIAALRSGYASGADPAAVSRALESVATDTCLDGDRCPQLVQGLVEFGALLADLERGCAGTSPGPADPDAVLTGFESLTAASLELSAWASPARELRRALAAGDGSECAQVVDLIDLWMD